MHVSLYTLKVFVCLDAFGSRKTENLLLRPLNNIIIINILFDVRP